MEGLHIYTMVCLNWSRWLSFAYGSRASCWHKCFVCGLVQSCLWFFVTSWLASFRLPTFNTWEELNFPSRRLTQKVGSDSFLWFYLPRLQINLETPPTSTPTPALSQFGAFITVHFNASLYFCCVIIMLWHMVSISGIWKKKLTCYPLKS